jgi:hypothetical protein
MLGLDPGLRHFSVKCDRTLPYLVEYLTRVVYSTPVYLHLPLLSFELCKISINIKAPANDGLSTTMLTLEAQNRVTQ